MLLNFLSLLTTHHLFHIQLPSKTGKKKADYYEQVPVIIRELLHRLNDDSTAVLKANHKALGALTSCVPAEELVTHMQFIRNLIASMVSDSRYKKGGVGDGDFFLPGFNMPKGKIHYTGDSHPLHSIQQ